MKNLFWTARSVSTRKFQPEENFYGWACLCAGDRILKAIPADFSLCDFSARLTLFSVAKITCIVWKSRRECSLGRCCARCCVLTCSFLHHYITQPMTGPLLRHLCSSPCVTFNLIFSSQTPCISKEAVTALIALWSVWSDRNPLPWGISDKPTHHWNLLSKSWFSVLYYFLNAVKPLLWIGFFLVFFLLQCKHCAAGAVAWQLLCNKTIPASFIPLLGFFQL